MSGNAFVPATRQDVLDLLKVAEDAALEAGEGDLAASIREAVEAATYGADLAAAGWIRNRLAEMEMPALARGRRPEPLSLGKFFGMRTTWEVLAVPEQRLEQPDARERFPVPFVRSDGSVHVRMLDGAIAARYSEVEMVGGTVPTFSVEIVPDISHTRRIDYDRQTFRLIEPGPFSRDGEQHYLGVWYQEVD